MAPFSDWYQNVPIFQNVLINQKVHFARSVHFQRSVPKSTDLWKCTDFFFLVEIVLVPTVKGTDLSKCTIDMYQYIFRNRYISKDRYQNVRIFENVPFLSSVHEHIVRTKYVWTVDWPTFAKNKNVRRTFDEQQPFIRSCCCPGRWKEVLDHVGTILLKSIKLDCFSFRCNFPLSPESRVLLYK
jgi:hypothetical protein